MVVGDSRVAMQATGGLWRIVTALVPLVALACTQSAGPATAKEPSAGAGGFVADTKPVPSVRWQDATVPKGTPIKLTMIDTLSPQTSHPGDMFRALVTDALMVKGT